MGATTQSSMTWKDKNVKLKVVDGNLGFLLNMLPAGSTTFLCTADLGAKIQIQNINSADFYKSEFEIVP